MIRRGLIEALYWLAVGIGVVTAFAVALGLVLSLFATLLLAPFTEALAANDINPLGLIHVAALTGALLGATVGLMLFLAAFTHHRDSN
ncbi:hypothetical protein C3941_23645 [Kaistia algarum]|uniref:hypothetical protein n=1 Tax=Kaistia algarum TaxID=2083279 RepID=UPI000CE8EF89|nr:hypothetical protein [Kaistia algarum]MCX5513448.1 hypothetical protein [Kaistia algarum]PPE77454.1 hypothetical protein C3941_23645 [Kaistia algarum]